MTCKLKFLNLFLILCILSSSLLANVPNAFKYQAKAMDKYGNVFVKKDIVVKISILADSITGPVIYSENHDVTTNRLGLFSLSIGAGHPQIGSFNTINWAAGPFYLKTAISKDGSYGFTDLGTSQLLSVPYSLHSATADALIASPFPPGVIMPFAGDSSLVPEGWLLCDGKEIDRNTHSRLYAIISNNYGVGDSSTTFNIPDYRGQFLRGVDYGAGVDPDVMKRDTNSMGFRNAPGSVQDDALQDHYHHFWNDNSDRHKSGNSDGRPNIETMRQRNTSGALGARLSSETRPTNVYVNFIIKY